MMQLAEGQRAGHLGSVGQGVGLLFKAVGEAENYPSPTPCTSVQ